MLPNASDLCELTHDELPALDGLKKALGRPTIKLSNYSRNPVPPGSVRHVLVLYLYTDLYHEHAPAEDFLMLVPRNQLKPLDPTFALHHFLLNESRVKRRFARDGMEQSVEQAQQAAQEWSAGLSELASLRRSLVGQRSVLQPGDAPDPSLVKMQDIDKQLRALHEARAALQQKYVAVCGDPVGMGPGRLQAALPAIVAPSPAAAPPPTTAKSAIIAPLAAAAPAAPPADAAVDPPTNCGDRAVGSPAAAFAHVSMAAPPSASHSTGSQASRGEMADRTPAGSRQAALPTTAAPPAAAAASHATTAPPAAAAPPAATAPPSPDWWTSGTDDIKWAEVLYENQVTTWRDVRDWMFTSPAFDQAFRAQLTRPEDRFAAKAYLYSLIEHKPGGPVMAHLRRLHLKQVRPQHLTARAGGPAARPKRVREGCLSSLHSAKKVWVSEKTGLPFYTDALGVVLE